MGQVLGTLYIVGIAHLLTNPPKPDTTFHVVFLEVTGLPLLETDY